MTDADDANAWSISECVLFLKSSFRDQEFAKVEAILTAREKRARLEIDALKEQVDLLRNKSERERLRRIAMEEDRLHERELLEVKARNAEMRCHESLEEVKRLTEQNKELVDLRRTNLELKCAKTKAEEELQFSSTELANAKRRIYELECEKRKVETDWRRKCDDVHERVSRLEKDVEDLLNQLNLKKETAEADGCLLNGENGRSPSRSIVEIVDTDDDCAPEVNSIPKASTLQTPAGSSGSSHADVEMGSRTHKRRRDEAFNLEDNALSSRDKRTSSCREGESGSKQLSRELLSRIAFEVSGNEYEVSSDSCDSDSDDDCDQWLVESEMVAAFKSSSELCMKAVCALHRMEKSEKRTPLGLSYSNRGFDKSSASRGTTLAKFLIDGDPKGQLKKTVAELQAHDPKALDDCKSLAIQHSKQLFEIYKKKEDAFFR